MSVTTSQSRISYKGDGVTVNFPFPYLFQNNSDIEVWVNNEQVTSGFTTSGASNAALPTVGGNVAFVTAPAIAAVITLIRNPSNLQQTVLAPNDPFPAKTVETMVDAAMLAIQRLNDILALQPDQNQLPVALSYPFQESNLSGAMPPAATRAGGILGFDQNGLPIINPLPASIGAGNMTAEIGGNGRAGFKEGVDFAVGSPSVLTLSQDYGTNANVFTAWDGVYQQRDSYQIVGNQIQYGSWSGGAFVVGTWPSGIDNVDVIGGTTLSSLVPAIGAVTDAMVAPISRLFCRINDEVHVTDPGYRAVGDGIHDDTAALIAAFNSGAKCVHVPFPSVAYRTTAPILCAKPVKITGDGVAPYFLTGPFPANRGPGSWIFLDHPGQGFIFGDSSGSTFLTGVELCGIGTYRNHVNPVVPGWTPTVFDFDFVFWNTGFLMDNVCAQNAYKAVWVPNNFGTRATIRGLHGQWFNTGIQIDVAEDTVQVDDTHHWPFWANLPAATNYQLANTSVLVYTRVDAPFINNFFSIYAFRALAFFQSASGKTSRLQAKNLSLDQCNCPIYVDPSVNFFTAQFTNVSCEGPATPSSAALGIEILGTNAQVDFVNLEGELQSNSFLTVSGSNNDIRINNLSCDGWGAAGGGSPMINMFAGGGGNSVRVAGKIRATGEDGPFSTNLVSAPAGTIFTNPEGVVLGTAEILAASTTVLVNHGLPVTPTANQIQVWMDSGIGSAKAVWVSNINATNFTINCDVVPGAPIFINYRCALE